MEDEPEYQVSVTSVNSRLPVDEGALANAARAVLRLHATPSARMNLALVDDARMAQLNLRHLAHEGPTDVLTFNLAQSESIRDPQPQPRIDGEIVVSVDTAAREAARHGHGVEAELALYVVHGVLHLLGMDDHDARSAKEMHEIEDGVLSDLGYGRVYRKDAP